MNKKLSRRQEAAAVLLAEDLLSDERIAAKVGVSRSCLAKWKLQETFCVRVSEVSEMLTEQALAHGLARQERRLGALQRRHSELLRVIEERAADPALAGVPGGSTGLIVRQAVLAGGRLVGYEYAVDVGTIRELRAIEEQVAKELGQLVQRSESKVEATLKDERTMTDAELRDEIQKLGSELYGKDWPPVSSEQVSSKRGAE